MLLSIINLKNFFFSTRGLGCKILVVAFEEEREKKEIFILEAHFISPGNQVRVQIGYPTPILLWNIPDLEARMNALMSEVSYTRYNPTSII